MKKSILVLIFTLITTFSFSQRKVNTTYLKVKSVKNASVLGTDNRGNVIDKSLDLSSLITVPEYQAGDNITIDKSNPLQPVINANETGGSVTGLEKITENGQTGWRLVGKNPSNYGDIGSKAVDLSDTQYPNSKLGATGLSSFSSGLNTTASNQYSAAFNRETKAIGLASAAFNDYTQALASYSFSAGRATKAHSFAEFSVGVNNTDYVADSDSRWKATDRVFNVGNGVNESNRSDAFTVLKNGTITAPSFEIAEINNAGGRALITKEYADATYSSGVTSIVAGTNISIDNTNPLQPIINAAGGGASSTNLTYTAGTSNGIVNSSTGTSATIGVAVENVQAGLLKLTSGEVQGTVTVKQITGDGYKTLSFPESVTVKWVRVGTIVTLSCKLTYTQPSLWVKNDKSRVFVKIDCDLPKSPDPINSVYPIQVVDDNNGSIVNASNSPEDLWFRKNIQDNAFRNDQLYFTAEKEWVRSTAGSVTPNFFLIQATYTTNSY